MDERVRDHAEILLDWSARIEPGDNVVVSVGSEAHDLAVAVAEGLGDRGANLVTTYSSGEITRAYLRAHDEEFDTDPAHELGLVEETDVYLTLIGGRNTAATSDVPGDRRQAFNRSQQGIRDARLDSRWMKTYHPTRSLAQQAGMSYEAYQDFVYDSILRDWEALADEMANLVDIFDAGETVRLVRDRTDVTMSIANRTAINSCASVAYNSHNLPSGEVFTAPYEPEGTVFFDVPRTIHGQRVRDVELIFEDGEVIDWTAAQGEAVLREVLATDAGAKRLGELGVGMNRGIDRPTGNIGFDEKMAGTVHLALGSAYEDCLPHGESGNESAVHTDLLTDMSTDARMEVDGEIILKDGVFRWEDEFDA